MREVLEALILGLAISACLLGTLLGVRWWFGQDIAVLVGMVMIMNAVDRGVR